MSGRSQDRRQRYMVKGCYNGNERAKHNRSVLFMSLTSQQLLERVSGELNTLPEEDLALVAAFVDYLKQRQVAPLPHRLAADLRVEAQQRAAELRAIPRADLVHRFQQVAEDVRQQAIAKNTAIEGDWERD